MIRSVFILLCGFFISCVKLPVDQALTENQIMLRSGDGSLISAYLFRPPTQEPRPAIIMMHGCSGLLTKKYGRLKSRETAWRDIFLEEGYVVLLVDSFTERGYRSICQISLADRPIEPDLERPHDAYGALRWLQSKSFVAPDNIVLGGWSNGAMSMLWTVFSDAFQRPQNLKYDFRAAFGFYPGCINLRERQPAYTAKVPTLLQLGADDNWTWPKPCQELSKTANAIGGALVIADTYKGAVHSFDHPTSKRRTITVSNFRQVWIGSNLEARRKSIDRIRLFLSNKFN
jgi:dienelactone hydrolase